MLDDSIRETKKAFQPVEQLVMFPNCLQLWYGTLIAPSIAHTSSTAGELRDRPSTYFLR